MKISTKTGLVGFFLALSALNIPVANATVKTTDLALASITIESRLLRITETLRARENQLPEKPEVLKPGEQIAGAWGNGGGGFVNRGGGGGGNLAQ
ncbi:MAG: GrrA/OscA1 family cyclophane-containing rSAM-modified RiPP [Planktothrix sp. GU0601_MAG3]|nr:MAG: GrrA/OscA1 family cyclophane-containing rSAM-modified RiPP [Planktothrix sp. GU0601_MAG3]